MGINTLSAMCQYWHVVSGTSTRERYKPFMQRNWNKPRKGKKGGEMHFPLQLNLPLTRD